MNDARPPFLAALEVDPAAELDERTLRRAYARKLKQIDVEAEPERFQALREALDHGLQWLGWREQRRLADAARQELQPESVAAPAPEPLPELAPRPAPLPAAAPVPPAAPALPRGTGEIAEPVPSPAPTIARGPALDTAGAPADAPRARPLPDTRHAAPPADAPRAGPLPDASPDAPPPDAPRVRPRVDAQSDTPAPASPPEPRPPSPDDIAGAVFARLQRRIDDGMLKDPEAGRALLLRFLADPGLVSIDARSSFEWRIARLLAGNWKPGSEHLFDAAVEIFGWNSDHARLKHFAQVGVLLTAAIRERATVQAFSAAQRAVLDALLERIRRAAPPEPARLADEVAQLRYLVERVPNWLRIVSPVGPVNERFEMWSQRPPEAQQPPAPTPPQPKFMRRKTSPAAPIGIGLMILMLLAGLGQLGGGGSGPGPSAIAPPHHVAVTPADDADLARRQKEAEALLARIRQPGGGAH